MATLRPLAFCLLVATAASADPRDHSGGTLPGTDAPPEAGGPALKGLRSWTERTLKRIDDRERLRAGENQHIGACLLALAKLNREFRADPRFSRNLAGHNSLPFPLGEDGRYAVVRTWSPVSARVDAMGKKTVDATFYVTDGTNEFRFRSSRQWESGRSAEGLSLNFKINAKENYGIDWWMDTGIVADAIAPFGSGSYGPPQSLVPDQKVPIGEKSEKLFRKSVQQTFQLLLATAETSRNPPDGVDVRGGVRLYLDRLALTGQLDGCRRAGMAKLIDDIDVELKRPKKP